MFLRFVLVTTPVSVDLSGGNAHLALAGNFALCRLSVKFRE